MSLRKRVRRSIREAILAQGEDPWVRWDPAPWAQPWDRSWWRQLARELRCRGSPMRMDYPLRWWFVRLPIRDDGLLISLPPRRVR